MNVKHQHRSALWLRVLYLTLATWMMSTWQVMHDSPGEWAAIDLALAQTPEQAPVDTLYFARWNINYGEYLLDVGKYLEALEAFQTAFEATANPQLQVDAALRRASTLATYLDAFDDARREYERILRQHPQVPLAETARYQLVLLLFDQQQYEAAMAEADAYLRQFPRGRFVRSVEVLLIQSRRAQQAQRPAPAPPQAQTAPTPAPVPSQKSTPPPATPVRPQKQPSQPTRPESVTPAPSPPQVRVRLVKATKQLDLSSDGVLTVSTISGQTVWQGSGAVSLRAATDRIIVGRKKSRVREVRIVATAPTLIQQKTIQCSRAQPPASGRYRGSLRVFLHDGKLRVVNELDIEAYLYGVVPAEVPASWPLEALKTQAITARTYALYQAQHRSRQLYDLVDTEGDQVYKGMRCENARSTQAVDATRGVLLLHGQRPILAMYSANTGSHSASVEDIFNKALPYLVGVPDPHSPTQPWGQWTRTHSAEEVREKLAGVGLYFDAIEALSPVHVTPSGRITTVAVTHKKGKQTIRARTTLRRVLDLPEVLVKITQKDQIFTFEGSGFGHGVGYSQWGAKAMADAGQSAREILHFYYHQVRLEKLW